MDVRDEYLTIEQVCDLLQISEPTLRDLIDHGLPFVPVGRKGKGRRFLRSQIYEWMATRAVRLTGGTS